MSRKFVYAILFLLVCIVGPMPVDAQTSLRISEEFEKKELSNNRQVDTVCGNLNIGGKAGWLFIELQLSPYISSFQRYSTGFSGKDILDHVYVDCKPYYLPDLFLSWPVTEKTPDQEVEGQQLKYFFKVKIGSRSGEMTPFVMKICRGPIGYWANLDTFIQMAQAFDLKAVWVEGDKEPENPLSQNLSGDGWNYGPVTSVSIIQQGLSITINCINRVHETPGPHYQITGTIQGNKITGTWRWIGTTATYPSDRRFTEARCLGGRITAEIASDWRSIRIMDAEDPCGHGWSGIVIRR